MTDNPNVSAIPYDIQTKVLTPAGTSTSQAEVLISCKFVGILTATATGNVEISFNGSRFVPLPLGIQVSAFNRGKLWIRNTSAADNTVTLYLGNDAVADNRLAAGADGAVPVSVNNEPSVRIAHVGTAAVTTALPISNGSPVLRVMTMADSSGSFAPAKAFHVSTAGVNAVNVKPTPATIQGVCASNSGATWAYLKLHQSATPPNVGVSIPAQILGVPPGQSITLAQTDPVYFYNGLAFSITGAPDVTDTTPIAAGQVVVSFIYQ